MKERRKKTGNPEAGAERAGGETRGRSDEPLYVISVAARLADVHPQTLRIYERKGLLSPARVRNRRRYSEADIEQCRLIQELTQDMGINLAGVKMILDLQRSLEVMRGRIRALEEELEEARREMEERVRMVRESFRNDIVPVPRGELMLPRQANPFLGTWARRGPEER
ncbi:MerR family transcriptional regulator [Candidatus Solincola tengchongensis]|uniref:heat shock protein transcriptional repressor HspR n=1 Tax=Candidatus Solincola tengchongensis TaxID=2900693 RepID=UPI002579E83B|nr:MerR family transcriptional regulator [Candidatus Solincola tengchongensis]